ncbi:MAG: PAS domain-containing protein [Thermoleophilia bacterium]|nr:PAS domain-containing protein [Thermoleophilia bacterium]
MSPTPPATPAVSSGDALLAIDSELRVVAWNAAAAELTGIPPERALGRRCYEVLQGRDDDGLPVCGPGCERARRALAGEPVAGCTLSIATARGPQRVVLSTLVLGGGSRRTLVHLLQHAPEEAPAPGMVTAAGNGEPVLTARQREILRLLSEGVRAGSIAERLGLSETTVRNHIRATLGRLGCHSQLEAVAEARRHGII